MPEPRPKPVTRAEMDAIARQMQQLTAQLQSDLAMRKETHAMVMRLHGALIEPAPGQDHGLLHRMAAVTIATESGQAAGRWLVRFAAIVAAISVLITAFYTAIRFGQPPKGT